MPAGVDWPELVQITERHGLASIVSYQLEYRFIGSWRAPPAVRERLQLTFNGLLNDNVHKLTRLKQLLSQPGAPDALLLGAASLADAFYPHIAFRPVESIDLLVRKEQHADAERVLADGGLARKGVHLGDGDIAVRLWTQPPGLNLAQTELAALWDRRVAARPYGPGAFRPSPADAILLQVAALAQEAFQVVRVLLVDLREMALHSTDSSESGALDRGELLGRARTWQLGRALHTAMALVGTLFPEAGEATRRLSPEIPARVAALLDRAMVRPALDPRRQKVMRAAQAGRRLLLHL